MPTTKAQGRHRRGGQKKARAEGWEGVPQILFYSQEGCHGLTDTVVTCIQLSQNSSTDRGNYLQAHPRLRSHWQWVIAEGERTTVF